MKVIKYFLNKCKQINRFLQTKTSFFKQKKLQIFNKRQNKLSVIVIAVLVISSAALFSFDVFSQQTNTAVLDMSLAADNYDSSTKTFTDRSGNNNDGVSVNSAIFETGRYGSVDGAMSFDDGEYIDTLFNGTEYDTLTFMFWAKADVLPSDSYRYIVDNSPGSTGYGIRVNTGGSNMQVFTYLAGGLHLLDVAIPNNDWHFYVIQITPTQLSISIDSESPQTKNYAETSIVTSNYLMAIGSEVGHSVASSWVGAIEKVRVHNYSFTDQEVQDIYNSEKTNFNSSSLQKGLLGYWTMNGVDYNASINEVIDRSGNLNQGTNYGAVLTTDRNGKIDSAMSFNGGTDRISLGSPVATRNLHNVTISAWVNSFDITKSQNIFSRNGPYFLRIVNSKIQCGLYTKDPVSGDSSWIFTSGSIVLSSDTWHHLVLNYNGSSLRCYVNNQLDINVSRNGDLGSFASMFIGYTTSVGAQSPFYGAIDDVRLYSRSLLESEIQSLYESYEPKITTGTLQKGLVLDMPLNLKYTLDETPGSEIIADKTPYSNDGQNYGATITEDGAEFDGVNMNRITIPNVERMNNFSLSVWAYNEAGGDSRHSVLRNFWEIVGTQICFWSYDFVDTYWRCSPSGVVPYDKWTHITTTWDGSIIRHYTDGNLVWIDSSPSSGTNQEFYSIGGYSGRQLKGKFSNLKIYNRTLAETEIKSLHEKERNGSNIIMRSN